MTIDITQQAPEGTPVGRVLLLPGARYTAAMHGLAWPVRALVSWGWHVTAAAWQPDAWGDDPRGFVEGAADLLLDAAPPAPRTLVLGKSLGTLTAGWAAARGVPGIWLTPLLHLPEVRLALLDAPRSLLVGGTADEAWRPDEQLRARHYVVEVPSMDHGMFAGPGWRGSWEALGVVRTAIEEFVA